jgi:hypothetical protein
MMTTLGAFVKHPKHLWVKATHGEKSGDLPKSVVQKGFHRTAPAPKGFQNFFTTRAQSSCRTAVSRSVVVGNGLRPAQLKES